MIDQKLEEFLNVHLKSRHSFFQLKYFLIGKEPTIQAKMHRCLEECQMRQKTLRAINLEIEEIKDNNELLKLEIEKIKDDKEGIIKKRQLQRKIKASEIHLEEMNFKREGIEEEFNFLIKTIEEISKVEPLKSWDDYDVQLEYWSKKLSKQVRERASLKMPIDVEVINTILALPDETPIKSDVIKFIKNSEESIIEKQKQIKGSK